MMSADVRTGRLLPNALTGTQWYGKFASARPNDRAISRPGVQRQFTILLLEFTCLKQVRHWLIFAG